MGLSACTTDDGKKTAVEGELDSELDDLADSEEKIDQDTTKTADAESTNEADAELETNLKKDSPASEDDEFLAEDSPAPKGSPADASAAAMAESDLEKELGKNKSASADGKEKDEFANFPSATVEEPPVAKANVAPPAPVEDPPIAPASSVEPLAGDAVAGEPKAASAVGGVITSKESVPGPDGFDFVNPTPILPKDDLGESDPLLTEVDPPLPSLKAAQELVRISKIDKNPFFSNERLMNTVYIARPNDDLGTISQKIYGEDKVASLLADNPNVSKGIEPGDKIYYTSPNRPEDKKVILTYYEDNKMAPAYYSTQQGDDIQKIGRRVLGFEDAWKEIWAVNEGLQTQALLPAGLKVRYWSGNELKAGNKDTVVSASAPPVESSTAAAAMNQAQPDTAEVPIDIPAGPETSQLNTEDPSMVSANAEPIPLLPDSSFSSPSAAASKENQSISSLGTVAGIAIVVLAIIGLIAIQIKNRKRNDMGIPPSLEFTKV